MIIIIIIIIIMISIIIVIDHTIEYGIFASGRPEPAQLGA